MLKLSYQLAPLARKQCTGEASHPPTHFSLSPYRKHTADKSDSAKWLSALVYNRVLHAVSALLRFAHLRCGQWYLQPGPSYTAGYRIALNCAAGAGS